jgi:hypothetical protein
MSMDRQRFEQVLQTNVKKVEIKNSGFLECHTMLSSRYLLTFRRNMLPPSSMSNSPKSTTMLENMVIFDRLQEVRWWTNQSGSAICWAEPQ